MKKTVKLTESDLMRIVKQVLNEQPMKDKKSPDTRLNFKQINDYTMYDGCTIQKRPKNTLRVNCRAANVFFDVKICPDLAS